MTIDVYSSTGTKMESLTLSETLFGADLNWGLMHQALVRQQSNRRQSPAHVKTRGEVQGSTRKLYAQKHTGQARRGAITSPLLRGGGKIFGPRNTRNFQKDMPRAMRHAAIRSCLSLQAKEGKILGLQSYDAEPKTKLFLALLQKLPIEPLRPTLIVTPTARSPLALAARNLSNVTIVQASYLNPEAVLKAKNILLLTESLPILEKLFGSEKKVRTLERDVPPERLSEGRDTTPGRLNDVPPARLSDGAKARKSVKKTTEKKAPAQNTPPKKKTP